MSIKQDMTIYKNEMNMVPFRNFTSIEMDLFFSICTKMRDKGLEKIRYSLDELKKLSNYKPTSIIRFASDLDKTYSKMLSLTYKNGDKINFERFVLFTNFKVCGDEQYVEITTNPELKYIINEINSDFTKFEMKEFTNIRSSYAKTAFRLLKQFRLTGFWKIQITDFKELFDIPKQYRITDIDARVIKPIQKELSNSFQNLKITKIKAKKKNKIEYLEFNFKPQDDIRKDGTKIFKDDNGSYYENDIEHFTKEEVNKSFPTR